ncbi:MAG: nodulation protein NfeD [Nitrospinota bacterium]
MRWRGSGGSRPRAVLAGLLLGAGLLGASLGRSAEPERLSGPVVLIEVADAISPGSAEYIEYGLAEASLRGAQLLLIRLDTPGGLVTSTRDIVKAIFSSEVPVAVFVAPGGAHAASAGTFITMSAHIAAMAPGTNIGAASPVAGGGEQIEGDARKKAMNDVAAFALAVASRMGRNTEWAESAVREAVSVDEREALRLKVIDLVAVDARALLLAVDGRRVKLASGREVALSTRGAQVIPLAKSWRQRVLTMLSDPNIAYILMLLGMYGLFFELSNPGAVLPGVVGAISLLLSLYALKVLPVNYAGLLLILLAVVLFLLEIKVVSYGGLTMGGVAAMTIGSLMLIDSPDPYLQISLNVILPAVAGTALFFVWIVGMGFRAQQRRPISGGEGMVGQVGVVSAGGEDGKPAKIFVRGEIWLADAGEPLRPGEKVRVDSLEGLRLRVTKVKEGAS